MRDIKAEAQDRVAKETKGASGSSLLRTAQNLYSKAAQEERDGDLKESLLSYTKVASLAKAAMGSSELKTHPTLARQITDFLQARHTLHIRYKGTIIHISYGTSPPTLECEFGREGKTSAESVECV